VTLNKMRRDHQDKVKQMEQEQAMLARMQMEQKLALLRQQKQEQVEFQQSLQQKRLEVLQTQRLEYEQKVAYQREMERKQLIEKEQKVIQHQFGPDVMGPTGMVPPPTSLPPVSSHSSSPQMYRASQQSGDLQSYQPGQATSMLPPPPVLKPPGMDASSLSMQSLSLQQQQQQQQQQHQAPPLPSKLEYSMPPSVDMSGPPPYNPASSAFSLQDPLASSQFSNQPLPPISAAHQWTNQVLSQVTPPTATGVHQPQSQLPQVNGYATSQAPTVTSHESLQQPFIGAPPPPSMQLQQQPPQQQQQPGYSSVHSSGVMGPPHQQQQQQLGMAPNYSSDPSHYGQDLHLASSGSGAMSASSSQHSQGAHMAPPPNMGMQSMGQQLQQQHQLLSQQQQPQLQPQQQQPQLQQQQQPQLQQQQQQQPGQFHPQQQQQGYGRQESEPPLISFD